MSLEQEIELARKEIVSDGYDMSVGEIINLYQNNELIINPVFQRLFRWDASRKTRFIESLLLGIPIPPIFVYQNSDGIWELIDGLQRLSTILEFVGILKDGTSGNDVTPLTLEGTKFLPSLANNIWSDEPQDDKISIGKKQQLQIKRARLRVEILKQESEDNAKYELFQRLNTGGVGLSQQEVRNCVAVMIDESFFQWLNTLASEINFITTTDQTDAAISQQAPLELALRFLVFRNVPYQKGLDVHEYLDNAMLTIIEDSNFDRVKENEIFHKTFSFMNDALSTDSFKKWNGSKFIGKFLMSAFEVISIGVSKNIESLEAMDSQERNNFIVSKAKELWDNPVFIRNNGAGVRGTTRLSNLLPLGEPFFRPQ